MVAEGGITARFLFVMAFGLSLRYSLCSSAFLFSVYFSAFLYFDWQSHSLSLVFISLVTGTTVRKLKSGGVPKSCTEGCMKYPTGGKLQRGETEFNERARAVAMGADS